MCLLDLIRQADKVDRHMRTSRIPRGAEGNPDLALALRMKTCRSQGASCGGKKLSSCERRVSRLFSLLLAQSAGIF
jgi:hypothetical protein